MKIISSTVPKTKTHFFRLLAQQCDKITKTATVSNFERVHVNDDSSTRSSNRVIFTRGPEPRARNWLPSVPSPLSICLLSADPNPSIQVSIAWWWNIQENTARVDGVDEAVVVWLVLYDGQPGPYLFTLQLCLIVVESRAGKCALFHCDVPQNLWPDLKLWLMCSS